MRNRLHLLSYAICRKDVECTTNTIRLPNSVDLYGQSEGGSIDDDETEYFGDVLHKWHPLSIKCKYLDHIFFIFAKN